MSEWKPIVDAPKNGTRILVAYDVVEPSVDAGQRSITIAYWTSHNDGGWVWYGASANFTHWMPLPKLPEDTQ